MICELRLDIQAQILEESALREESVSRENRKARPQSRWETGISYEAASAFLRQRRVAVVKGFTHQENGRAITFLAKLGFRLNQDPDEGWVRLTLGMKG